MIAEVPRGKAVARRHLVEHDSKGEQIGARVEFFSSRLLGRHVSDSADGRAVLCEFCLPR